MSELGSARTLKIAVIAFIAGLAPGFLRTDWWPGLLILTLAACLAALYLALSDKRRWLPLLAAAFFLLGIWRGTEFYTGISQVPALPYGSQVKAEGYVASFVEPAGSQKKFLFQTELLEQSRVETRILVYAREAALLQRGDRLVLNCELQQPASFDGFAYDKYLAGRRIFSLCFDTEIISRQHNDGNFLAWLDLLRQNLNISLNRLLSYDESGLANSVVLGIRSGLTDQIRQDLQQSGLLHISAVSGMHIGILLTLIVAGMLALSLNRRFVIWPAIALIVFYVLLVGSPPSAVRAGIMAALFLLAMRLGRLKSLGHALILAAGIMAAARPSLLFEAGFQLSFGAMLGIIYIYPLLRHKLNPRQISWLDILLVTASVQLVIWPIAAYHFQTFSVMTFAANLLVLPVLPVAFGLTLALLLVALVIPAWAWLIAYPVYYLWHYILFVSRALAALPVSSQEFSLELAPILFYFIFLIIVIWFGQRKTALHKMTKMN